MTYDVTKWEIRSMKHEQKLKRAESAINIGKKLKVK